MISEALECIFRDRQIAYVVTDRQLKVLEVFGSDDLFGVAESFTAGTSLFHLVPDLEGNEEPLQEILAGQLDRLQLDWVSASGSAGEQRYLRVILLPVCNGMESVTGLICVGEDVTELGVAHQHLTQKHNDLLLAQREVAKINLDLMAANADLRRLSQTTSSFVTVAAHELRTPLSTIKGYSDLLLQGLSGDLAGQQQESLEIINRSVDRLLLITGNLLDVARLEAERLELTLLPMDLAILVEDVVAEFRKALDERNQELVLRIDGALPAALCDETRMCQIMANLLGNANKYTPAGGVIQVTVGQSDQPGELLVQVADSGVGIPKEDQPKLFRRFFRAHTASSTGAQGVGLGLYITKSLIELHGGRIWVESTEAQGSTFFFTVSEADVGPDWYVDEPETAKIGAK
ncbi:MAG: HAMP domain-containing sensor histidine kinase [Chloroflexota bacterium]|nr:HAMP domain-containing sensor histidine kinase [Chloroflexota bacterium]